MTALILLTVCMLVAALLARRGPGPAVPPALADGLNWWVINIALPATILELVPGLHFDAGLWFLILPQWVGYLLAFLLFRWLGRRLHWSIGRVGALTLTCGLSNTAFIGYPMLEALRGTGAQTLAVVADQLGCFISLSVGGVLTAVLYGQQGVPRMLDITRKIMVFPPFVALMVAVVAGALGGWPTALLPILHRIGQTLAPLALFSVALSLQPKLPRGARLALGLGLGWKLGLAPLLTYLSGDALQISTPTEAVSVLEMGMGPMLTGAILSQQYRLEPELANAALGLGILLSFLTVPAWNLLF
jgi:predicted permease